jgi:hypothetical protein
MSLDFDGDGQPTCRALIQELQRAYMALVAGQARIRVRFDRRWTEYHPASATQLKTLINTIYDQCDDVEGLLDLRPRRGRPMYLRIT